LRRKYRKQALSLEMMIPSYSYGASRRRRSEEEEACSFIHNTIPPNHHVFFFLLTDNIPALQFFHEWDLVAIDGEK